MSFCASGTAKGGWTHFDKAGTLGAAAFAFTFRTPGAVTCLDGCRREVVWFPSSRPSDEETESSSAGVEGQVATRDQGNDGSAADGENGGVSGDNEESGDVEDWEAVVGGAVEVVEVEGAWRGEYDVDVEEGGDDSWGAGVRSPVPVSIGLGDPVWCPAAEDGLDVSGKKKCELTDHVMGGLGRNR
jgi:hypothetical protein